MLITITSFIHDKNTLSIIANINVHNRIITPSTTRIIEISMLNAIIPSIIINTRINRCRTVVTTTICHYYRMIAINTTIIIITSTRAAITTITNNFLPNRKVWGSLLEKGNAPGWIELGARRPDGDMRI